VGDSSWCFTQNLLYKFWHVVFALAAVNKTKRKEQALELIKVFELMDLVDLFPETLSGGEKQRIAIITALANYPIIIMADEPTSNIDDQNSQLFMNHLTIQNKKNRPESN